MAKRDGIAARWARLRSAIRRHRWPVAGGVCVVALLGVWALWPAEPPPRARQYLEFTACLLAGARGIAEPAAGPVWGGMQEASRATRAKVQYLAVVGPQTADNAAPFLASLAQGRCDLVFVAGEGPIAAVPTIAGRFPDARFYAVGGAAARNVSTLDGSDSARLRAEVARIVADAARAAD